MCSWSCYRFFLCMFVWLILNALNDSSRGTLKDSHESISDHSRSNDNLSSVSNEGAGVAVGVKDKLQELFALLVAGTATGSLAGVLRAAIGVQDLSEDTSTFCLFPISIIFLGLLIRVISVRLIQGKSHLKGWKIGVVIFDGFIVSSLLAIAMTTKLPPAVRWDGTISDNQLLWIPMGVVLGFLWGISFGGVRIIASYAMNSFFRSVDSGSNETEIGKANDLGAGFQSKTHLSRDLGSTSVEFDHTGDRFSTRRQLGGRPCSCCLAAPTLVAFLFFGLMASLNMCSYEKDDKDRHELPPGCPKNCEGADLTRFRLVEIDFSDTNLVRARLTNADLERANLRGAVLTDALMLRVDLRGADLSEADFSGADLRRAILLNAKFENTVLRGAYLGNATLQDLDLSTADLKDADLRDAAYNSKTIWPPGFDVQAAGLRIDEPEPRNRDD